MSQKSNIKKRGGTKKNLNIYNKSILNRSIAIKFNNLNNKLNENLLKIVSSQISGICVEEGFICPDTIKLLTYSNGVVNGEFVNFDLVLECEICNLSEGQIINCIVENITKAGIKAKVDDEFDPLIIFIARDHNYMNELFSKIDIGSQISVKVIGQRFELNDKQISIIARLNNIEKVKLNVTSDVKDDLEIEQIDE